METKELIPLEQNLPNIDKALSPFLSMKLTVETQEEAQKVLEALVAMKMHEKLLKEREAQYLTPHLKGYEEAIRIKAIFKDRQNQLKEQTKFLKDGLGFYRLREKQEADRLAELERHNRLEAERLAFEEQERLRKEIEDKQKLIDQEADSEDWANKAQLEEEVKQAEGALQDSQLASLSIVPEPVEAPQAMRTDNGIISDTYYNDYEVIDIWEIPRQFLKVEVKRKDLLEFLKCNKEVPGVKIIQKVKLSTRTNF